MDIGIFGTTTTAVTTSAEAWTPQACHHGKGYFRLQQMEQKTLENVGTISQQAGVREEKWPNLDLKHLKFP